MSALKAPKPKKCGNPECRKEFVPRNSLVKACSINCGIAMARLQERRVRLKVQREARKAKREWRQKTKSIGVLLREAQHEFNRFVRERDWDKPCISSGLMGPVNPMEAVKGHCWDAGHYRSVGAAPHLRFNEDNAHKQLVNENRDKSGNIVEYRKRLIERIGLARVEALENDNRTVKWDRDELVAIRRKYLAMWKDLKAKRL